MTGWFADIKFSIADATKSFLPFIQTGAGVTATVVQMQPAFGALGNIFKSNDKAIGGFLKKIPKLAKNIFQGLIPSLGGAATAQWSLNAALNANPVGAVIVAIGAVVGAITFLVIKMDKIKAWFNELSPMGKALARIGFVLTPILVVAHQIRKIIDNWDKTVAWLQQTSDKIMAVASGIKAVFNRITAGVSKFLSPAISAVGSFVEDVKALITTVGDYISDVFRSAVDIISNVFAKIRQIIVSIGEGIIGAFHWIKSMIISAFAWIQDKGGIVVEILVAPFVAVKDFVVDIFQSVFDFISDKFDFIAKIADKLGFTALSNTFKEAYDSEYEDRKNSRQRKSSMKNQRLRHKKVENSSQEPADEDFEDFLEEFTAGKQPNMPVLPKGGSPSIIGDAKSDGVKNINISINSLVSGVHNHFRSTDTVEDANDFFDKLKMALLGVVNDVNYS